MRHLFTILLAITFMGAPSIAKAQPSEWSREWTRTDFSKSSVDFSEIISGGPPKDGIRAIDIVLLNNNLTWYSYG